MLRVSIRRRPAAMRLFAMAAVLLGSHGASAQLLDLTEFTYQGSLSREGVVYTGSADLRFTLFASATEGEGIGESMVRSGVEVSAGLFAVGLEFSASDLVSGRFLGIEVRTPAWDGTGEEPAFFEFPARTPIGAAPFSLHTRGLTVAANGDITLAPDRDLLNLDALVGFNDLRFFGNPGGGVPDIFVSAGGNVGIGTTSPSSRLTVNGDVRLVGNSGIVFPNGERFSGPITVIHPNLSFPVVIRQFSLRETVSVPGAQPGMAVIVTPIDEPLPSLHAITSARVFAPGQVEFYVLNASDTNSFFPATQRFRVTVLP